jgi:hypothetical protein
VLVDSIASTMTPDVIRNHARDIIRQRVHSYYSPPPSTS